MDEDTERNSLMHPFTLKKESLFKKAHRYQKQLEEKFIATSVKLIREAAVDKNTITKLSYYEDLARRVMNFAQFEYETITKEADKLKPDEVGTSFLEVIGNESHKRYYDILIELKNITKDDNRVNE